MANNPFDPPIVQVKKLLDRNGMSTVNHGFGSRRTVVPTSRPAPAPELPPEGVKNLSELGDVDTTTVTPAVGDILVWDGTHWVPDVVSGGIDPWTYAVATVETSTTSNAASVACTGLTIPSLPDGIWEFHALVRALSAVTSTGTRFGLAQGAGMSTAAMISVASGGQSMMYRNLPEGDNDYASSTNALTAPFLGAVIDGIITASSATGTVDVTLRSEISGSEVKSLPGSFIKWRQIA